MPLQRLALANRLLAGLPEADLKHLLKRCKRVQLSMGDTFHEPDKPIEHACFPLSCFLSIATQIEPATDLGVRLVGWEGVFGVVPALGVAKLPLHVRVQGEGDALLIKTAHLRDELSGSPALRERLNAYICVLLIQLSNSGVCFQHAIESRLARWLLMTGDGARSDDFQITHDFLAYMLGVRRAGVTLAAQALQSRGSIKYQRGHVRILDRATLEAAACECYRFDIDIYQRVLGAA